MPKTSFTDGITPVLAAWLNKVFSHIHDGADVDGSADRVLSDAHVQWSPLDLVDLLIDDFTPDLAQFDFVHFSPSGVVEWFVDWLVAKTDGGLYLTPILNQVVDGLTGDGVVGGAATAAKVWKMFRGTGGAPSAQSLNGPNTAAMGLFAPAFKPGCSIPGNYTDEATPEFRFDNGLYRRNLVKAAFKLDFTTGAPGSFAVAGSPYNVDVATLQQLDATGLFGVTLLDNPAAASPIAIVPSVRTSNAAYAAGRTYTIQVADYAAGVMRFQIFEHATATGVITRKDSGADIQDNLSVQVIMV
jgi:hypothetical protein